MNFPLMAEFKPVPFDSAVRALQLKLILGPPAVVNSWEGDIKRRSSAVGEEDWLGWGLSWRV